jgi:hypothetical protein
MLLVVCTALFAVAGAQAVHDLNVFELDGNAVTNAATPPPEDWDLICKANPSTCTKNPNYTFPSGTTVSDPNSFVVDPSESAQDDILKGGTKDDNDIGSWAWTSAKPSPPKNDITDAYAAEYTCKGTAANSVSACTGTTGDKLLYFGGDRFSNSGSANLAFWFFQHQVAQTPHPAGGTTCDISAGCPFSGTHTAGRVPHDPNHPGDILIISAFGPKAQIQVYEWVGVGNAPSPCFTNACSLVPLIPASAGQACSATLTLDNACAIVNDSVQISPWILNQKNAPANSFQPTNFFEGGVNLTALGLAKACFSSFLMNTRASAAGDAELHDKVVGQLEHCGLALTTVPSKDRTTNKYIIGTDTSVTDTATVQVTPDPTGQVDPTGPVTFYLCGPVTTLACSSTTGTQVGTTSVQLVGGTANDGTATATSVNAASLITTPGDYCFAAKYDASSDPNYSSAGVQEFDGTTECFTVVGSATLATAQNWLPNDTAHIQGPTGTTLSGTVTFSLYNDGSCGHDATPGTVQYGPITKNVVTDADTSPAPTANNRYVSTTNTTFKVTTANDAVAWSWKVSYDDANLTDPTDVCETTTPAFTLSD